MGLPTGVELKTAEPVKVKEMVEATAVEEVKPVEAPVDTAAAVTANADSTDAAEVRAPAGYSLFSSCAAEWS